MKRLVVLALCLLFLCGCGGQTVRERNMEIAARAAEAYREGGADYWDAVEPNYQPLDEDLVYWVKSGYAYHSTRDCVALLRSKDIQSGTLLQAMASGHDHPCSKCVG